LITATINAWDDSDSPHRALLRFIDQSSGGTDFATFWLTAANTDHTDYIELTVTPIQQVGSLTGAVSLGVAPVGNMGAAGLGTGDLVGPASSTDGHIPQFDGTTGKLLKDGLTFSTSTSLGTSNTTVSSQLAVKTYIDASFAANDAMLYKGATDCSANPNYPAGNAGETYRVSVAGKIGGASGVDVEAGDFFICNTDDASSGNQATVGTSWNVIQTNLSGAVLNTRTISTATGLSGGGDLSANRTISLDINALTEDTTPDTAADFVLTYDTSASVHKKVKPSNLSAGGGGSSASADWALCGGGA
jgi:hypothetical protein